MQSSRVEGNLNIDSEVGIMLPTYCEAANIEKLILELENSDFNPSILVIDDSSPDGTADIVRKLQKKFGNVLLLVRSRKMGLGTAITDGFKAFLSMKHPPKYIVTMDADYSHNPNFRIDVEITLYSRRPHQVSSFSDSPFSLARLIYKVCYTLDEVQPLFLSLPSLIL